MSGECFTESCFAISARWAVQNVISFRNQQRGNINGLNADRVKAHHYDRCTARNSLNLRGMVSFYASQSGSWPGVLKASGKYGWLGVDVFFVVSGFVIPYSLDKAKYGNRQFWVWPFIEVVISRSPCPHLCNCGIRARIGDLGNMHGYCSRHRFR